VTRAAARDPVRDRLLTSVLLAVLLHALAFVALELLVKFAPQRQVEYRGPLFVQLEEQPVVQQARQAAPAAAALGPSGQAAPLAVAAPAVAAETPPPLPSGPPLRAAGETASARPATKAPSAGPSASPFRMEGASAGAASPAQQAQPRPAGQGVQTPSAEPTLPASGVPGAGAVSPQGPPLRAVAPGSESQAPSVPLEAVDRALAGRPLVSGGQRAGTSGTPAAGGGTLPGAQTGTGQGELAREGISILLPESARGREPTFTPRPMIPKWVSNAGLTLTVEIAFVLTPQGVLHSVRTVKSSGHSDVDSAVLDAVRRWKFQPGGQKGLEVNGTVGYLIVPTSPSR
jgi:TonB family protein